MFGVDPKPIYEWCRQKPRLKELASKKRGTMPKHLEGAGRRPFDEEIKRELFEWIIQLSAHIIANQVT